MEIELLEIGELREYEDNPRLNDNAVELVAESIKEFGFKNPIIIDKHNIIIAGHTRLKASKLLGLKEVPVIKAEDLTEEQVKAFRIADNRTGEIAEWDMDLLEKEIAALEDMDYDIDVLGFEEEASSMLDGTYDDYEVGSLARDFIIPPVNIFDTRRGDWIERKRIWRSLINDNGESRDHVDIMGDNLGKDLATVSLLDPVLSEIVYRWFSPELDNVKVFDPFAGDTIFGYVSSYLGAEFTGIELRKEQADLNNERVQESGLNANYITGDGRKVLDHIPAGSQDMLFSCPPYYDLEVYSDLEDDASNQDTYEEFYEIVDEALTASAKALKDNRFAVIVAGDVRSKKTGEYYGFLTDIKDTMKKAGLIEYNDITLINSYGTAGMRARGSMRNRKVVNVKQSVLVFYKGDANKIQEHFGEVETGELEDESGSI